jgi:hypothetical protein
MGGIVFIVTISLPYPSHHPHANISIVTPYSLMVDGRDEHIFNNAAMFFYHRETEDTEPFLLQNIIISVFSVPLWWIQL